jgi:hypothetical protein
MVARWTFMVYMAGNNTLSGAATEDLREMKRAGSSDDMRALAFVKQRSPRRNARRMEIGRSGGQDHVEDLGDLDSGNPQTVIDFFRWGVQRAPAEKYAFVFWNHGGGWAPDDLDELYSEVRTANGVTRHELNQRAAQPMARALFSTTLKSILALPTEHDRQICNDDSTFHSLDTIELGNVLKRMTEEIGRPLDLLGMDACLMSTLEVAYQACNEVRVVVGSEELEPGAGWCYDRVLGGLRANPGMSAEELARAVVDEYVNSYRGQPDVWPVTQCAIDAAQVTAFATALDGLVGALRPQLATHWTELLQAQARSARFQMDLVDLKTLCQNLAMVSTDAATKNAAQAVIAALAPGQYVLAEGHLGPSVQNCGGVTAYFPAPTSPISQYYKDLAFAQQHHWDELLSEYHQALH